MLRWTIAALAVLLFASQARAVPVELTLTNFIGTSSEAKITLDDTDGVITGQIDVVPNPNIGDLRGVFFSFFDDTILGGLNITSPDLNALKIDAGKVWKVGNAHVSGGGTPGPFDIGVELGTPGIGKDDIQSTSFLVSHNALSLRLDMLDLESFALRMTSVGLPGSSRSGSSKLRVDEIRFLTDPDPTPDPPGDPPITPGNIPPNPQDQNVNAPVPEPATIALLAVGAGVIGVRFGRRRRSDQSEA